MPIAANRPAQRSATGMPTRTGPLARQAGDRHQPAHALRDLVEARPVRVRPVLPEARDAGIDEPRIDRGERLVIDAEALLHVGAEILHHDVGLGGHFLEHRDAFRRLQVQRHRALVAVQVLEVRTLARTPEPLAFAHVIRHLDLDAVRAPVGELAHAGRTGAHAGEIEHGEAVQRSGGLREGHAGFRQAVSGGGQSPKSPPFVYARTLHAAMRDRSTSRSIRAARTSLTCVIGSRTSGLSINPSAPQPMLDRRGARLREQEPRQVGERAPGAQRSRLIAADEDVAHRRETRRVDMRGSQNATFGALGERRVEQRILTGHHGELRRLGADQIEGLLLVRAAILHARNVRKLREAQQRVVAHVHAGPIRDVVDEDRPLGRTSERREVAIESLLRGARVIRARDQIAVDRPRGRVRERLGDLPGVAAGYAEIDRPLARRFRRQRPQQASRSHPHRWSVPRRSSRRG